jgi:D-amino-acid dehydrogenase
VAGVSALQTRAPDVVIVGAGALGLMTALELTRRGIRPVVLERGADVLAGCSSGSAGLLSPAHSTPLSTPAAVREGLRYMLRRDSPFSMRPRPKLVPWLLRFMVAARRERVRRATDLIRDFSFASLELHKRLAEEGLDTGLEILGALNVYETERAYAAGIAEAEDLSLHGIKSQVMTPHDVRNFEPALSDGVVGGLFYPDEGQCDPERFLLAVAGAAVERGAVLCTRAEVLDARVAGGQVVSLDTTIGQLHPRQVVVANGAWTIELSRRMGLRIPVEGGKGYHVDLRPASTDPRVPIYLQEARVIATPYADHLRLAGTLQLTGLSMRVDEVRVQATLESGIRTLRGIDPARVTGVWRGIRPCTPDGLPILGRSDRLDNVVFATGHAMKGLHLAPETGRVVTHALLGEDPGRDLTPFSPDRFSLRRRTGLEEARRDE